MWNQRKNGKMLSTDKHFFLIAFIVLSVLLLTLAETYDTKYDNVDLDEILKNERLLKNYIKCLLQEGPCTPDGKMLRETIPDAMQNDCSKCSEKQKYGADKVNQYLIENSSKDYEKLEKMYDPQGVYRKRYLAAKESIDKNEKIEVTTNDEALLS